MASRRAENMALTWLTNETYSSQAERHSAGVLGVINIINGVRRENGRCRGGGVAAATMMVGMVSERHGAAWW